MNPREDLAFFKRLTKRQWLEILVGGVFYWSVAFRLAIAWRILSW